MTFPSRCIFFDTETKLISIDKNTIKHELLFCCCKYVNSEFDEYIEDNVFTDIDSFWNYVTRKSSFGKKLYLFAHNSDFDFRIMKGFTQLKKRGYSITKCITEFGRFLIDYQSEKNNKDKRESIIILDTMNFFKTSVEKLGEILQLPKLSMPTNEIISDKFIEYCQRDVEIIYKTFSNYISFLKTNELGSFGVTLPKQSINAFKYKYMTKEIEVHNDQKAKRIERASYFGGRTEAFYIGKITNEKIYYLDINSMYPYVMMEYDYPTKLVGIKHNPKAKWLKENMNKFLYIADVEIETTENQYPYRDKRGLLFPVGKFKTTLCSPELFQTKNINTKIKVYRVAIYERSNIFKDYITDIYTLRRLYKQNGNVIYEQFCKLFMNSLYGKFAQHNEEWIKTGNDESIPNMSDRIWEVNEKRFVKIKSINGEQFQCVGSYDGFDTFTAIASFVTSYARAYLNKLLILCGKRNVYYCDTDSLFVNEFGYESLIEYVDQITLGKLKLEKISDYVTIRGLKDYTFGNENKIKGVRKNAEIINDNTFLCDQWEHIPSALRKDHLEDVYTKKQVKVLKRDYKKGTISSEGWVEPLVLQE